MLNFFRQKGLTSAVYGVIIVATILVFVIGFNPTAGKKLSGLKEDCAARVHGSCIEPKAHRAAFKLVFSRGTGGMRQAVASKIILEGLIERELLAEEATRLGLTVSEDEITDAIFHGNIHLSLPADSTGLAQNLGIEEGRIHVPYFNDPKTKSFDMKAYEKNVKQLTGRSPTEFREWQSRELLAAKMRDLVRSPIRVADDEAYELYAQQKTTSTVGSTIIRKGWIERYGFATEQKDIDAWAKDKANLVAIKGANVRHILISYRDPSKQEAPPPTPEYKAEKKKKADDIVARLKKGEDFAKLAKEFSDDPGSKDKGGFYEASVTANFDPKFMATFNKLAPGELADAPTESESFGYFIIKKEPLDKEELAKAYKATKSGDIAKKLAEAIAADIKGGQKPEDAVAKEAEKFAVVKVAPTPKEEKKDPKAAKTGRRYRRRPRRRRWPAAAADDGGPGCGAPAVGHVGSLQPRRYADPGHRLRRDECRPQVRVQREGGRRLGSDRVEQPHAPRRRRVPRRRPQRGEARHARGVRERA